MSVTISADVVKTLRERTGAAMMDCKKALVETGGDMEKAIEWLRKKGAASAEKKVGRRTNEGLIEAYIHPGSRLGVLIEVNCETDFVAKTPEFRTLVRDLAMQIAATNPRAIAREEIPAEQVEKELEIYRTQARNEKRRKTSSSALRKANWRNSTKNSFCSSRVSSKTRIVPSSKW